MDLCPEHFLTSASVGHLITLYDRAVAVPALVRPLDEVRIEDVSDLGRHQGAGEFLSSWRTLLTMFSLL